MEKAQNYKQLFIGGDLSGIQKFLYNISSKKAAVSLKGRSAYLREYMSSICEQLKLVVENVGAKYSETIYCSGGKFYMITDNGADIVQAIGNYACDVKSKLWAEHLGQLGINISYVAFTENADGTVDACGEEKAKPGILWRIVNADFARQKSQKFKDIIQGQYDLFFEPIKVGANHRICAITGVESEDCVEMLPDEYDKEPIWVLPSVRKQIQLGESLRNTEHFKTFEQYAGKTDLGILRMDVDGLGKRFITGFNSIKEYKDFSNRLVMFFENEISDIQREVAFRDYLNIIYAGGDDLFIVGRWDKVIDFAERVHKETVARFGNENISISGGIAVVKPKFPIAKAAEMAGEAESAAKSFRNGEKNSFNMLGKTVSWNKEFDFVKSYKHQFVTLCEQYDLSKAIFHKIMLYSSIAENNKQKKENGEQEDYSYIWHFAYYISRYMKRYEKNEEVKSFCMQLKSDFANPRNLELMALAARWAELILKDEINN